LVDATLLDFGYWLCKDYEKAGVSVLLVKLGLKKTFFILPGAGYVIKVILMHNLCSLLL